MTLLEEEFYRDVNINTILPPISKEIIHLYFSRYKKKIDDAWRMYESRYLIALRACQVGNDTYLKGICKASMKKIQYEVNIKLQNDGAPDEANCECAVGSGQEAHSKHVAVVMFATEQMFREKLILLHIVPTQKLQSFHKPKKAFTASPMKAEKLPSKRHIENIIFHPYDTKKISKHIYNDRVRNICIGATSSSMPMKQRYGPANPYGVINDHSYLNEDARDVLLRQLLLNNVSTDDIKNVEQTTKCQLKSVEWQKLRQDRITASRFHTICHLTPQRQAKFAEQMLYPSTFKSRATTHGIINEPVALAKYMEEYDLQVEKCGLFLSKTHPFLGAFPDGLLGNETVIEVKCPYSCMNLTINSTTVPFLYEENGDLFLKKTCAYYYQIQGQLFCTDIKYCNLIIYTYKDFKVIYISRDNDFIKYMVDELTAFFDYYFKDALFQKYIYRNYK